MMLSMRENAIIRRSKRKGEVWTTHKRREPGKESPRQSAQARPKRRTCRRRARLGAEVRKRRRRRRGKGRAQARDLGCLRRVQVACGAVGGSHGHGAGSVVRVAVAQQAREVRAHAWAVRGRRRAWARRPGTEGARGCAGEERAAEKTEELCCGCRTGGACTWC